VVDGPYCPEPVTARDFAKKMGPLGEFLVITPGHVMALSGGRLLNQSGCGNDRVAAVFWLKERIS
jgi:hypothetical protein